MFVIVSLFVGILFVIFWDFVLSCGKNYISLTIFDWEIVFLLYESVDYSLKKMFLFFSDYQLYVFYSNFLFLHYFAFGWL